MKTRNTLLAIALLALGVSGVTQAQSCASPIALPQSGNPAVPGDTCTAANQLGTLCGAFASPENDIVYSFTIVNPHTATTFTLTNNTPGWNPGLVLLSGSCGGGVSCLDVADNTGAGGNESFAVPGGAGNYFLIVTSSPGAGGCGSFTIDPDGTLPVHLKNFSVE